jgi:hypothetical protein
VTDLFDRGCHVVLLLLLNSADHKADVKSSSFLPLLCGTIFHSLKLPSRWLAVFPEERSIWRQISSFFVQRLLSKLSVSQSFFLLCRRSRRRRRCRLWYVLQNKVKILCVKDIQVDTTYSLESAKARTDVQVVPDSKCLFP